MIGCVRGGWLVDEAAKVVAELMVAPRYSPLWDEESTACLAAAAPTEITLQVVGLMASPQLHCLCQRIP